MFSVLSFARIRVLAPLGTLLLAGPAAAQSVDKAYEALKQGDYESAAVQYDSVLKLQNEAEGDVAEAQYGLASSFKKLGLHLAALKAYEDIVRVGNDHPYFDRAVEGLVDVGEALQDDLKVPQVLDSIYTEANMSALQKMKPVTVQRVHYVLGRFHFNRGNMTAARRFLKTVKPGNPSYPHAQYLLGLIRLGVGKSDEAKPKYDEALQAFESARTAIPADTKDERLLEIRDLATLGIARTYYEQAYALDDGDPKRVDALRQAVTEFQRVPRFAGGWGEAMMERAWAHTVANEYGRALGALHSLKAPYFSDTFFPEAGILQAIIYYYNCQWDRVNKILADTKASYEPMVGELQKLLEKDIALDEWYPLLQKSLASAAKSGDSPQLPPSVATAIQHDPKLVKMEAFLREADREAAVFTTGKAFSRNEMGREMAQFAKDTKAAYLGVVGKLLRTKVQEIASELNDITTRASLVALETRTAEADWLEQGRSIDSKERHRLPRPFIPDDSFQFWWFRNEYWIDELGYYEFTVKTECYD